MRPNFYELNSSGLVKAYNDMASEATSLGLSASLVKRFSTRDAGLRRCEALYRALCEKKGEEYQSPELPPITEPPAETEVKKAKPKKAKPKATKVKAPKAKITKPVKANIRSIKSEIVEACKVGGGTKRAKALDYLSDRLGKQCSTTSIMAVVYGSAAEETSTAAFFTVMKSLERDMITSKCKYELKRVKDEKGIISYGIYSSKTTGN